MKEGQIIEMKAKFMRLPCGQCRGEGYTTTQNQSAGVFEVNDCKMCEGVGHIDSFIKDNRTRLKDKKIKTHNYCFYDYTYLK